MDVPHQAIPFIYREMFNYDVAPIERLSAITNVWRVPSCTAGRSIICQRFRINAKDRCELFSRETQNLGQL
jgi:hypothetical protein